MKCPNCKISKGIDNAPHMKVEESTTDIFMKCPDCGYAKGVKKTGYRR